MLLLALGFPRFQQPEPPPSRSRNKAEGVRSLPAGCLTQVHAPPSLLVPFQLESEKEYSLFIDYLK